MDIDARKEKREKAQSENLLSIIWKEISPNVYTFPERKKNDRPDIVLAISEKRIGIEVTECYPSNIIRKTKRFAIPKRAVYFLKTKRTHQGVLPPQYISDRITPVFIKCKNGVRTLSEPRSSSFVASLPLFALRVTQPRSTPYTRCQVLRPHKYHESQNYKPNFCLI